MKPDIETKITKNILLTNQDINQSIQEVILWIEINILNEYIRSNPDDVTTTLTMCKWSELLQLLKLYMNINFE